MLGLSAGLLVELLGKSWSGTDFPCAGCPSHPHAPPPWGDHLQEMLQSLPQIFLAPCFGACRNPRQRTQAAREEDPKVHRDGWYLCPDPTRQGAARLLWLTLPKQLCPCLAAILPLQSACVLCSHPSTLSVPPVDTHGQ